MTSETVQHSLPEPNKNADGHQLNLLSIFPWYSRRPLMISLAHITTVGLNKVATSNNCSISSEPPAFIVDPIFLPYSNPTPIHRDLAWSQGRICAHQEHINDHMTGTAVMWYSIPHRDHLINNNEDLDFPPTEMLDNHWKIDEIEYRAQQAVGITYRLNWWFRMDWFVRYFA